jgi:hypothetical protein
MQDVAILIAFAQTMPSVVLVESQCVALQHNDNMLSLKCPDDVSITSQLQYIL